MSGITISVTLPRPLEKKLSKNAKLAGMSRSRFIGNILLKWEESFSKIDDLELPNNKDLDTIPNDCVNRESDGVCRIFDIMCNAPQSAANTCSGNPESENNI